MSVGRSDEVSQVEGTSRAPTVKLLQAEVDEVHIWLQGHVSDHCAINYQHHAVNALFEALSREGMDTVGAAVQVAPVTLTVLEPTWA